MSENALEQVETPAEEKVETPTEPLPKPSEETKTPTLRESPEFKQALKEAQSGWDRKLSSMKQEGETAKKEAKLAQAEKESVLAELKALQEDHDELAGKAFGDDPDERQKYLSRVEISKARREVAKKEAEAERKLLEADLKLHSYNMAKRASELSKDTGIPFEELEDCESVEQMEIKALRFQLKSGEKAKTPEVPSPKIDSGITTGKGGKLTMEDMEKMSVEEIAQHPSTKARYK